MLSPLLHSDPFAHRVAFANSLPVPCSLSVNLLLSLFDLCFGYWPEDKFYSTIYHFGVSLSKRSHFS